LRCISYYGIRRQIDRVKPGKKRLDRSTGQSLPFMKPPPVTWKK